MLITTFNQLLKKSVQDTTDSTRKINQADFVPDKSYLVSLDAKSLYTNIQNEEEIKFVKTSLEKYFKWTPSTAVITTFLALILTLNNNKSSKKTTQKLITDERQRHGNNLCTLMGKYLYGPLWKKIYMPIYQDIFIIYLRSIDDIFLYGQAAKPI